MKISDNIFSFHQKILWGYIFLVAVIASMAAILVHERERIREIEVESAEIRQFRRDINATHSHIIRLATLGESVIGWEKADSIRYRALRLHTDSLLQALKPHCRDYVRPAQIDTLPLGGKGSPPAAPDGNPCPSGRGGQSLGEPPARSGA